MEPSEEVSEAEDVKVLLSNSDSVPLSSQVCKISKEKGLDVQNYECSACKYSIGVSARPK